MSHATVAAALKARRIKALLSPVVTITVAVCTAVVLWRGPYLFLAGVMTVGALTVCLSYLSKFSKPVKDLGGHDQRDRASCSGSRSHSRYTDTVIPQKPDPFDPPPLGGQVTFKQVAFPYDVQNTVLTDVNFTIKPAQLGGDRRSDWQRQVNRSEHDSALLRSGERICEDRWL